MMECENFCYETFECDEDCQMDLYDTMEEANGPACREYDALFFDMETGEYTDEEDIEWSPKNMELYEKCMEETEATFVDNFSEFEEMFQCVEACYMDLDSGMGFEEWEENDELEGESDCDDYVCYYEIFECM